MCLLQSLNIFPYTGWDISSRNIAKACEDARVLDISIQDQLRPLLSKMKPRPSIYCPDFIAANQEDRADNTLSGTPIPRTLKYRDFNIFFTPHRDKTGDDGANQGRYSGFQGQKESG